MAPGLTAPLAAETKVCHLTGCTLKNLEIFMETNPNSPQPSSPPPAAAKKPYHTPEILYLAPLESTADVCDPLLGGKADGTCTLVQS